MRIYGFSGCIWAVLNTAVSTRDIGESETDGNSNDLTFDPHRDSTADFNQLVRLAAPVWVHLKYRYGVVCAPTIQCHLTPLEPWMRLCYSGKRRDVVVVEAAAANDFQIHFTLVGCAVGCARPSD